MKKFTKLSAFLPGSVYLLVVWMLGLGACSTPQHFGFTAGPPEVYKKDQPVAVAPATPATPETEVVAPATTLTAGTAAETVVLPEIAALQEVQAKTAVKKNAAASAKATATAKPQQKLTLAQKVVLHKLQKQVNKLEKQNQQQQAAAGPVSNRSAIALILIGLIIAVFGTIISPLYTIGVLVLLVGLVLLILNYI